MSSPTIEEQLSGITDDSGKISFLLSRLHELELAVPPKQDKNAALEKRVAALEKALSSKDAMLSKAEVAKSKLEQLCRELNNNQKAQKEENYHKLKLMQRAHNDSVESFK